MKSHPNIPFRLLWEYDPNTFDFERSYKIVIERIIERGWLDDWKEMVRYYTKEQILETVEWSAQLSERNKNFTKLFIHSFRLIIFTYRK